jgi:hypothetical protein
VDLTGVGGDSMIEAIIEFIMGFIGWLGHWAVTILDKIAGFVFGLFVFAVLVVAKVRKRKEVNDIST